MNMTKTRDISGRSAAIGIVVLMAVAALAIVPMCSDDSEAVTDLGVYTGGTNLSSKDAAYSGIEVDISRINGMTLFVSMGAQIKVTYDNYVDKYDDNSNGLGMGWSIGSGTVSEYGSCRWEDAAINSFKLICLDPNNITNLGPYTGGENLSFEKAAYSGVNASVTDDAFPNTGAGRPNDIYVLPGAHIRIVAEDTGPSFTYYPNWFISSTNGRGLEVIDGTVPGYGEWLVMWDGIVHIDIGLVCLGPSHTVTFNSNGGSDVPNQVTDSDGYVIAPEDPVLAGHVFAGWFTDDGEPFDFSQPVTSDITLHAQWVDELVFTTTPTSNGTVQSVPMMEGMIVCDATQSSDYTSILWDLGDGTFSTNTYVTHSYASPGQYTVTLTVFNEHGSDTTEFTVNVPEDAGRGGGAVTSCPTFSSPSWHSYREVWSSDVSCELMTNEGVFQ